MARLTGEWQTAGAKIEFIGQRLTPTATEAMKQCGQEFIEVVRGHIDKQDLPWKPLASTTVEGKGSSLIYIDTGDLYNNGLRVRALKSSKKGSVFFAGANPWTKHKPSGMKMNELLSELEYGTDRIPPRPIIRPSIEEFKADFPKKFSKYMSLELRKGGL